MYKFIVHLRAVCLAVIEPLSHFVIVAFLVHKLKNFMLVAAYLIDTWQTL